MIFIYITCGSKKEANKIASHLLKKHLIACSNILHSESIYKWKGKIVRANEYILICKTRNKNYEIVRKEVKRIHSYKIPCILKLNVKANKEFQIWLNKETS